MRRTAFILNLLISLSILVPASAHAGATMMKAALDCQVTGACGGDFDPCANTKTGAQNEPVEFEDTKIEDPCEGTPAAVCAACSGDMDSDICKKTQEYYCGQLGWCK